MWEGGPWQPALQTSELCTERKMTLRASYLLSEHYDRIPPTSTCINNNINNEGGSKNWVILCHVKETRSVQQLTRCFIFQKSLVQTVSHSHY